MREPGKGGTFRYFLPFSAMNFTAPSPPALCQLLSTVRNIAIVGLSPNPARPAFQVAQAMQSAGYRIIPVRPALGQVLGETAYPDLSHLPERPDMVNVFRAPEHIPAIVEDCIRLGIRHLWLQQGVIHEAAAQRAVAAGIVVVMDRCLWREYLRCRADSPHSSLPTATGIT
jgi:hypothetical protein